MLWALNNHQLIQFLNFIWDVGGSATPHLFNIDFSNHEIFYTTSQKLIRLPNHKRPKIVVPGDVVAYIRRNIILCNESP